MRQNLEIDMTLADRARRGDQAAWETIIHKSSPSLRHLLGRHIVSLGMTPEDVAQHFWMRVHQRDLLKDYNGSSPLAFWFRRRAFLIMGELFSKAKTPKYADPLNFPQGTHNDTHFELGMISCDPEQILMYNQLIDQLDTDHTEQPRKALNQFRRIA